MLTAGIDAGGSKTECIIVDTDENQIIARAETGAANYQVVGLKEACQQIKDALEAAKHRAGISRLTALGIGLAGAGRKDDLRKIKNRIKTMIDMRNIFFSDDGYIALLGATGGSEGIVLIAGTGSIAYGLKKSGSKIRSGGWGPIIGDEGSGYWIAVEAIKRAIRASENRAPETSLKKIILQHFDFDSLEELIPFVYQGKLPRKEIAALTPEIFNLAQNGEQAAVEITENAVEELALLANSLKVKLDYPEDKIAGTGGLIKSDYFYDLLERKLSKKYNMKIYKAKYSAAYGAVFLALEELKNRK